MNRALLNPFEASDLPEAIEEYLEGDKATCMVFNRHGNLLAVGTSAGRVVIWDFDTRSVASYLGDAAVEFASSVTSVSFPAPRNGSTCLVSYEVPGMVRLFDTLSGVVLSEVRFDVPILQAAAHPKDATIAVAVPKDLHPVVLHLRRGVYDAETDRLRAVHDPSVCLPLPRFVAEIDGARDKHVNTLPVVGGLHRKTPVLPPPSAQMYMTVLCTLDEFKDGNPREASGSRRKNAYYVCFTRKGHRVMRGGPSGLLRSFSLQRADPSAVVPTAVCDAVVLIPGRAAIRSIVFSRRNDLVLVNSQDRTMRLFDAEHVLSGKPHDDWSFDTADSLATFTEVVNKQQCVCACFSRDGDFILGGMEGSDHRILIWRVGDGQLERTLEGPKEGIAEVLWHPLRPVIASLGGNYGGIYVWSKNFTENWSAFAAEFSELEHNEEYKEAEDEFDQKDPEDDAKKHAEQELAEEQLVVDVETCDRTGWFTSDSEDEDTFFYLPAQPIPDGSLQHSCIPETPVAERFNYAGKERASNGTGGGHGNSRKRPRVTGSKGSQSSRRQKAASRGRPRTSDAGVKNSVPIDGAVAGVTHDRPPLPSRAPVASIRDDGLGPRQGGASSAGVANSAPGAAPGGAVGRVNEAPPTESSTDRRETQNLAQPQTS